MTLRTADLAKLNSITKYPPIPTLHALDGKGVPTDVLQIDFAGCDVHVSEKVDGTNARILVASESFAIGSREHLLTVSGDVLFDPACDIVVALSRTGLPEKLARGFGYASGLLVVYGEVYGGKVTGGSKQYTADRDVTGFRVFDAVHFGGDELGRLAAMSREEVASWREGPRSDFLPAAGLRSYASFLSVGVTVDYEVVPLLECGAPPTDRRHVHQWLCDALPATRAAIDATGAGKPEGVVVRTHDRSRIAKVRFDDYRRVK
jgi:hypothetical protein